MVRILAKSNDVILPGGVGGGGRRKGGLGVNALRIEGGVSGGGGRKDGVGGRLIGVARGGRRGSGMDGIAGRVGGLVGVVVGLCLCWMTVGGEVSKCTARSGGPLS
jgi:hypothetical protein